MPFIYRQQATRASKANWWTSHFDDYDTYMSAGSAGELGRRRGLEQVGFWKKILVHPGYDAFWQDQAVDKLLAARPLQVPVMLVHSLWDQEDIYGAIAVYQAIEPKDANNDKVFLVMGPWYPGQAIEDGSALGALKFNSNTALYFRQEILRPFLAQYLKEGAPKAEVAPIGYYDAGLTWPEWLVDDQREASGRPDVVVFVSEALTAPVKISGQPVVNLVASTSGTDADWVVKLIDVYPDEVAAQPEMGGYQLMVSGDIFRGRYRESLETARAIAPNKPLPYRFALPTANHVFLPGHRLMVQVQSSWFPLYDRNPQKFVPNIFWAKPEDYQKAVHRIYHASNLASFVELPLVTTP